jgi:uncharacterized protein (TIGR00730 family)
MPKAICVYSSSSDAVAPEYFETAALLGAQIARNGYDLVYGGSRVGLMGALARSVHSEGGRVIGVIPQTIHSRGVAYDLADELIVTADLRERKARMEALADAFMALPGGFGTLEEVIEALTLKQLQVHDKPIIFIITLGFYDRLVALFEQFYDQQFAKGQFRDLYNIAPDAAGAFEYLRTYTPTRLASKWF